MTRVLRVAFRTLGCKVNRVESEDIAADLLGRGAVLAEEDVADVVIINTCTVTAEADAKARKSVRQALAASAAPIVVVTGCLASVDASALEALDERVVVEADKERVAERVAEILGIVDIDAHHHVVRAGEGFRTRAMLKIEDGCDNFCSYCIVPYARGVPRSVPLRQAVAEAERLVSAGAREIVLTGINIGRYDNDGADLAALVAAIAGTGIERLRLSSIEPPDLTERLLETLAATPAVCRHLHVPLQSGSDEVLSAMRRTYTTSEYRRWLEEARVALPGLSVTTDVIAGFPAESDSQAEETVEFCREMSFSKLHVFRYSVRPGTPAAEMEQVDPRVKAERAVRLRRVGDDMRRAFAESHVGTVRDVLVERDVGDGVVEGTTRDYLRVRISLPSVTRATAERMVGEIAMVRLRAKAGELLEGTLA